MTEMPDTQDQKLSEEMAYTWQLLDRFRGWLRRGHRDVTPDGMARMLLLTDDPWRTYIGTRSWCDGRVRPCRVCGGRCCACRHTEAARIAYRAGQADAGTVTT